MNLCFEKNVNILEKNLKSKNAPELSNGLTTAARIRIPLREHRPNHPVT